MSISSKAKKIKLLICDVDGVLTDGKVTIDEQGIITEKVTVVYQNTSSRGSAFGGDYKNYLRFILPLGATLETVEVNNVPIAITEAITNVSEYTKKGFIPPSQLEVEKTEVEERAVYGFLSVIPAFTSQKISIVYKAAKVINPAKAVFNYNLYIFKQPGTGNDLYSLSLAYPKIFQVVEGGQNMSDVGGKLLYEHKLDTDKNIVLKFSRK